MQTKEQLYKIALRQVQSSRQRALIVAKQKYETALQQIPQFGALKNQFRFVQAQLAKSQIIGVTESVATLQQQAQQIEQNMNQVLAEQGISFQQLEPQFQCSLCQDTGEYQGKTCRCIHLLVCELRRQEISAISPLELSTFESFSLSYYPNQYDKELQLNPYQNMSEIFQYCQKYATHFSTQNPNLLMTGTAGLGKTHLALAIANTAIQRGADVVYISCRNLFDQMEQEKFSSNSHLKKMVLEAELLVLDDLGTEFLTQYGISFLYDIVNSRILRRLPTIYTTNIIKEDMLRARYTEKTASRLLGCCELLNFHGNDIRLFEK